jgi:ACT domain-containing protein
MSETDLEKATRQVAQAVTERLGTDSPQVVELVVREVVAAMSGAAAVPAPSTPPPPALQGQSAAKGGDQTVTTALGAKLPAPRGGASLEMCTTCMEQVRRQESGSRAVVTTTGRNARGVVARVSTEVADAGGDIQDISQTIIGDFFTMIMVVELSGMELPFASFKERILVAARDLGIHAVVMHEEVMRSLQRV